MTATGICHSSPGRTLKSSCLFGSPVQFFQANAVESVSHYPVLRVFRNMSQFHIVLYEPEIPDNTGAVGRTCVALNAKLWLVKPLGFQVDDRRIKRAGLDYWQYLDCEIVDDFRNLRNRLGDKRYWYLSKKSVKSYTEPSFVPGDVFVFGSESLGLPPSLLAENPDTTLRIPIRPEARSLNLSVSVAIVLSEAKRQIKLDEI